MTHGRRFGEASTLIHFICIYILYHIISESNKARIRHEAAEFSAFFTLDFSSPTINKSPFTVAIRTEHTYFLSFDGPSSFSMLQVIANVHFNSISYKIDRKVKI